MLLLKGGGGGPSRSGLVGLALVGVGLLILLSGVALLLVIAAAGAVIGGAVMAGRRLVRGGPSRPVRRATNPLELEADYEILPAAPREHPASGQLRPPDDRTSAPADH